MFIKPALAVALCAGYVAAQAGANSTIDPNSVSATLRSQWCSAQLNTCGTLCSGDIYEGQNTCDTNTLNYTCTCASNQSTPGLQYYTGTMPTFICEQVFQDCIASTVGVAAAQAKCNSDEKNNCGHLDPNNFTAPASSSSSSSAPTSTAASTSAPASSSVAAAVTTSSSKAAAATMMAIGREYGSGVVAAGVAAAFGMML
ncbi:hypothetical protein M430DRAFT_18260 [Amorphotheca resinae ATCC 22711]|uniref:DUF7707 domain-containing protein n=1 Tax=Amorphotheca resinae ATCC 22711 TaxID=857342 RepID=A0A2T3B360_AMORE|nr:hypothetical protein M430DRAFT_18260 [Amorphotheca resinae ATCC 22711]PSS20078.1 hypothetical protein M430DRAFT_18260 [Amorphotheca resinae ATCC 22711]